MSWIFTVFIIPLSSLLADFKADICNECEKISHGLTDLCAVLNETTEQIYKILEGQQRSKSNLRRHIEQPMQLYDLSQSQNITQQI